MMELSKINENVERYLNGYSEDISITRSEHLSNIDTYKCNCVVRLCRAYTLYCTNKHFHNDYLLALRDYLLAFQTSLKLDNSPVDQNNEYGLWIDPTDSSIHASMQLPVYLDEDLVRSSFLNGDIPEHTQANKYDLHTDPLIYKLSGFSSFKSIAQKLAVYGALNTPDGYTTMVSLPTGGGKSLITQTISYQQTGLTIIIVPTVSLAIDQVRVAKKTIITDKPDEEIFYYSAGVDLVPIIRAIRNKSAKMLFISPEALLLNEVFVKEINSANASRYLRNIVIDEAHIVVDWGSDFRIDYQCLESWRNKLLSSNPQLRTVLLSATFEPHCIEILKNFFSSHNRWIEIRCDSLRHEPRFALVKCKSNKEKKHRIVEIVQKCPHPMIVYVARPVDADEVKQLLIDHGIHNVETFTGLTSSTQRRELIDSWVDNQFEIMIATSAFGVGVDKSDVRTVLHTYIPQNPNAYYQELGRGGRDRLPCLSLMCIVEEDLDVSFNRISKKVMTVEKIIGRWDSLYNDSNSKRLGNYVYIDTTIKPQYSITDELDDSPASETDIKWNVYVLLLLRRYKMIHIEEVLPQQGKYVFVIEVLNNTLLNNDLQLHETIEKIHEAEWAYHMDAYNLMRKAYKRNGKQCWSEMFYETYDKVSEFCAGCAAHHTPIVGDSYEFALKAHLEQPTKELDPDQKAFLANSKEVVILAPDSDRMVAIDYLLKKRVSSFVIQRTFGIEQMIQNAQVQQNTLILNIESLRDLFKKKAWYFLSGMVAVVYQGTPRDIFSQLATVRQYLNHTSVNIVHLIQENIYFEWIGKSFSDLIEGAVLSIESIRN